MRNFLPIGTWCAVSGVFFVAAVQLCGVPNSKTTQERSHRLGTALLASGGTSLPVTPLLFVCAGGLRRRLTASLDQ